MNRRKFLTVIYTTWSDLNLKPKEETIIITSYSTSLDIGGPSNFTGRV